MSSARHDGVDSFRLLLCFSYLLFSAGLTAGGQPDPSPQLRIARTGLGYLQLSITNAVPGTAYELISAWQPRSELNAGAGDQAYTWEWDKAGQVGQTNFHVVPGRSTMRLFRAQVRSDWDRDGVRDWQDARPYDPAVGLLNVVIDSPAHHATVN